MSPRRPDPQPDNIMIKNKTVSAAVRLFGGAGTPVDQRPTIDTPEGPVFAGTPEVAAYLELKAWVEPLVALSKSLDSMVAEKPQLLADIADLLTKVPETASRTVATLRDLHEVLQGRLSSHSGMTFKDPGRAFAVHVVELRNHADRAAFNLSMANGRAPRPPHPSQGPAQQRNPLGTWYREHGDY